MILFSMSGGGQAGTVHLGYYYVLSKFKKVDIFAGVSIGAILGLCLAVGMDLSKLVDITLKTKTKQFLKKRFSLKALFFGNSIGVQDIPSLIKKYVSESEYNTWRSNPDSPELYVMSVCYDTGNKQLYRIKNYSFENALLKIAESAAIPIYTQDINRKFDGGVIDHNCGAEVLERVSGITEVYSGYTRELNIKFDTSWRKNIFKTAKRSFDIAFHELSAGDQRAEQRICNERKIKYTPIFAPKILKNTYDDNISRKRELFEQGKIRANEAIKGV